MARPPGPPPRGTDSRGARCWAPRETPDPSESRDHIPLRCGTPRGCRVGGERSRSPHCRDRGGAADSGSRLHRPSLPGGVHPSASSPESPRCYRSHKRAARMGRELPCPRYRRRPRSWPIPRCRHERCRCTDREVPETYSPLPFRNHSPYRDSSGLLRGPARSLVARYGGRIH